MYKFISSEKLIFRKINRLARRSLIKSEFSKNVITLMAGTGLAQAIPVLLSPILTRIYTPEELGVFALYLSITTTISIVATGRYELAILLPEKDADALHIAILAFTITCLTSLALIGIVFIFKDSIINLLGMPEIKKWLYFVPITVFLTGAYQNFNYWNNRKKNYKYTSLGKITQSSGMMAVQISNGLLGAGSTGLVIGAVFGQLTAILMLAKNFFSDKEVSTFKLIPKKTIKLAKKYKEFPLLNTWSSLLNTASVQLPVLLLTVIYSATISGLYSLAQRVLLTPISLIGTSIGQVYFQKISQVKHDKIKVEKYTLSLYKKLLLISFFPTITILVFGGELFSMIFGEPWRQAGIYAQILSIWILFVFISSPLSYLMIVYQRHKQSIYFNLLLFTSRASAISLGFIFNSNPLLIITIYGIAGSLLWAIFTLYLLNLAGIRFMEIFLISAPYIAIYMIAIFLLLI